MSDHCYAHLVLSFLVSVGVVILGIVIVDLNFLSLKHTEVRACAGRLALRAFDHAQTRAGMPSRVRLYIYDHRALVEMGTVVVGLNIFNSFPGQNVIQGIWQSVGIGKFITSSTYNLLEKRYFYGKIKYLPLLTEC